MSGKEAVISPEILDLEQKKRVETLNALKSVLYGELVTIPQENPEVLEVVGDTFLKVDLPAFTDGKGVNVKAETVLIIIAGRDSSTLKAIGIPKAIAAIEKSLKALNTGGMEYYLINAHPLDPDGLDVGATISALFGDYEVLNQAAEKQLASPNINGMVSIIANFAFRMYAVAVSRDKALIAVGGWGEVLKGIRDVRVQRAKLFREE